MLHVSTSYCEIQDNDISYTNPFAIFRNFKSLWTWTFGCPRAAAGGRGLENQVPKLGALQYLHRLHDWPNAIGSFIFRTMVIAICLAKTAYTVSSQRQPGTFP